MILLEAVGIAFGAGWAALGAALVGLDFFTPPTEGLAGARRLLLRRRAWRRLPTRSSRDLSRLADILKTCCWRVGKAGSLRSETSRDKNASTAGQSRRATAFKKSNWEDGKGAQRLSKASSVSRMESRRVEDGGWGKEWLMEFRGFREAQRVSCTRPDSVGRVFALFAFSTWQSWRTYCSAIDLDVLPGFRW
jgi:hypothetical protein